MTCQNTTKDLYGTNLRSFPPKQARLHKPSQRCLLDSSFIHKSQPTMIVIRRALLLLSVASVAVAATVTASTSAALEEAEFAFFNGGFVDYRLGPVPAAASTGGAEESSVGGNDGSKGTHYGDPADGCMQDEVR